MSEWRTGAYLKGFSEKIAPWQGKPKSQAAGSIPQTEFWVASWWPTDSSITFTNTPVSDSMGNVNTYEYVKPMIPISDCAGDGGYENSTAQEYITGANGCSQRFPSVTTNVMALPSGKRSVRTARWDNGPLFEEVADRYPNGDQSPWAEVAGLTVRNDLTTVINALKDDGCYPDYVIADSPPGEYDAFGFFQGGGAFDAAFINNITTDAKASLTWYSSKSFNDLYTIDGSYSLTFGDLYTNTYHPQTNRQYLRWGRASVGMQNAFLEEFVYKTVRDVWGITKFSNYDGGIVDETTDIYDINGHPYLYPTCVGDASSPTLYGSWKFPNVYGVLNSDHTRIVRTDYGATVGGTTGFADNAWNQFLILIQKIRGYKRSNPTIPLRPWIASVDWPGDTGFLPAWTTDATSRGLYWESIRHFVLTGSEMLHYWGYGDNNATKRTTNCTKMNAVLQDINGRTGGFKLHNLNTGRVSFLAKYVATGFPGKKSTYLWRITPKPGVTLKGPSNAIYTADSDGGFWYTTLGSDTPIFKDATLGDYGSPESAEELP